MYLLKKLTRLLWVLMMKKECNQSIQQKHMHMGRAKIWYVKLFGCDDVTKQNIKEHNPNWSQILDHLYRMLTLFRMNFFRDAHGWRGRGGKKPPPPHLHKICHTYAKMMKLGTVIPYLRKIQKNIKTTWLTLIILLTSAFIHWKLSNLDISRSTDTDFISFWCIIYNSFRLFWVYKGCPSKYCYNFDNVNKSGYASSS